MKVLFSLLLVGLCSMILPKTVSARTAHVTGNIQGTHNGQPCLLHYDVTVTYEVVLGIPPIAVTSVHGTLTGCGGTIQFLVVPNYNNGGPVGQDPNGQNTVTSMSWSGIQDQSFLAYLNSQEMQIAWCNEMNNVIVPQLPIN